MGVVQSSGYKTRLAGCKFLEDKEMHSAERMEVYDKIDNMLPKEENLRLDYFRHQANQEYHLRQRMTDNSDEPYRMLGPYQSFLQAVHGLGAPYAHHFPMMSPLWEPPEKFGEINLEPIMGGIYRKSRKKPK